jgi:hypothetical protein
MTPLTPQDETAGMLAYEQAQAFASVRSHGRLLAAHLGFLLALIALCGAAWRWGNGEIFLFCVMGSLLFMGAALEHRRRLVARHARNLQLLAELEARYGEDLPWLRVERHLAAMAALETEGDGRSGV